MTNSNCDTCLVEDKSIKVGGMNSTSLDYVNHDHICQPFCLENDFCDTDSVPDSMYEDMISCSGFIVPTDLVNFVGLNKLCCKKHAHMCNCCSSQGYHFKR